MIVYYYIGLGALIAAACITAGVIIGLGHRRKGPKTTIPLPDAMGQIADYYRREAWAADPARVYEDPIARAVLLTATGTFDQAPPTVDPRDELRGWVRRWVRKEISPQQLQGEMRRMFLAHPELLQERLPAEIEAELRDARRRRTSFDGLEVSDRGNV